MAVQRWLCSDTASPGAPANKKGEEAGEKELRYYSALHHCPRAAVLEALQEFRACNKDSSSCLTYEEFLEVLRRRAHLPVGAPIPAHLMGMVSARDIARHGDVSFDSFLEWSMSVGWTEEMQSCSSEELDLRRIAREVDMPILDVEKIKKLFDMFDSDHSGQIEEDEFRYIILKLWRVESVKDVPVKTLRRIWRQIDQDGSGKIDFPEFLVWYNTFKNFGDCLNMI